MEEVKAVGTVVNGDKDGLGAVENLVGRTETVSEEFVRILNENRTENERLNKVLSLLKDNWSTPMNEAVTSGTKTQGCEDNYHTK